jgi:hypothetical protein
MNIHGSARVACPKWPLCPCANERVLFACWLPSLPLSPPILLLPICHRPSPMGPSRTYPLSFPPPPSSASPQKRPSSIAELAQRARDYPFDPAQSLKSLVKAAEQYNKLAKEQHAQGNREEAFVNFAKAATIVLEKLPQHRDYHTLLSDTQRSNIGGVSTRSSHKFLNP